MMPAFYRFAIVALVLGVGAAWCVPAVAKPTDDQGFVDVFNGEDLSGWETTGNWVVAPDGVLKLEPKPQRFRLFPDVRTFLWLEGSYDDFVLDLEFKVDSNTNSGVFVRCESRRSYLEAQICDSHGKQGPLEHDDCGAVLGIAAPAKNMAKPAGEWNHLQITCDDDQMLVELNGEQVVDVDLSESDKTRDIRSGRIGLQNNNTPVAYRNIRIKRLN